MSRIDMKKLLLLTLAAVLLISSAAYAGQDILPVDKRVQELVNYKTEPVVRGTYLKTTMNGASEYFPLTYNVRFMYSDAKFVEYTVKRGDVVKKGDILARFTITGSEVQMTKMELDLARAEESLALGIESREKEIAKRRAELASVQDEFERAKKELQLRKLEIELEQYIYRQERNIDRQKEAIADEIERRETNVLISPVDGVVTETVYKKVDDAVGKNERLVTIYSEDVKLLRIDNGSGGFRYNMPVQVTSGTGDKQVTVTGRIVAADDAIPEKERTGHAFVLLDPYDEENIKLRSPKVIAPTISVDDVLIIKRKTVTLEAGKYFVTKLTDGMVQKRFIEYGLGNSADVWVLNGLSEGDTLIID